MFLPIECESANEFIDPTDWLHAPNKQAIKIQTKL